MMTSDKTEEKEGKEEILGNEKEHLEMARKVYERCSGSSEAVQDWIEVKLAQRIGELFARKKDIHILAHEPEEVSLQFLQQVMKSGRKEHNDDYRVKCTVVAGNDRYRQLLQQQQQQHHQQQQQQQQQQTYLDLTSTQFEWFRGNIKTFLALNPTEKFDVVHFFRCLYDVDDIKTTLTRFHDNNLFQYGFLTVIGEDVDSFQYKTMKLLTKHKTDGDDISKTDVKDVKSSADVVDWYFLSGWLCLAKQNDWRYHSYRRDVIFDVTSLYGKVGPESDLLLDHVFRVKDARANLPEVVLKQLMDLLDVSKKEQAGKKVLSCKFGAICVIKE